MKLIDTSGHTTSLTTIGFGDGHTLPTASFGGASNALLSFAIDPQGKIVVSDEDFGVIRRVALDGSVTTVAGLVGVGFNSPANPLNGVGTAAQFGLPGGIAVAPDGSIYVPDLESNVIRKIAPDGTVTTFAGVAGQGGTADGSLGTALFSAPLYIVRASSGVLYVSDFTGETIRRIATDGTVTTLAGTPNVQGDLDGTGASAKFSRISALALDSDDVLYAVDEFNKAIRKITPAGVVTTLAGGLAPDTTPLVQGFHPTRLAIAADKTVYVTNSDDHVIQSISPAGVVSLIAGNPGQAFSSHENASFLFPTAAHTVAIS